MSDRRSKIPDVSDRRWKDFFGDGEGDGEGPAGSSGDEFFWAAWSNQGGEGIFVNFNEATARADQAGGGNKLFKTRCDAEMFLKKRSGMPLRRSNRQTKLWFGAEAGAYDSWENAFRACTNGQLPEPFEEHKNAVAWSQSFNGGGEAGEYLRATGFRACAGAGVYDA